MYDPCYLVECAGTPLAVVECGGLVAWLDTVPPAAYKECTVWYVDENGEAVKYGVDRGQK